MHIKAGAASPVKLSDKLAELQNKIRTAQLRNISLKEENDHLAKDTALLKEENKQLLNEVFQKQMNAQSIEELPTEVRPSLVQSSDRDQVNAHKVTFMKAKEKNSTLKEVHSMYEFLFMPELKR